MVNILVAKIQAGVEVRVIVDYFGNLKYLKRKEIQRLRKLGIDFRLFNPPFMKKLPISF